MYYGSWIVVPKDVHQRRQWHPSPVLLPGRSLGWRSLEGCSPWGRWASDTTERLHFHFSVSCIGEGNGNPFQCSCLENPRDRGAWWAAVYGVAQSRIQLKWLNSKDVHRPENILLYMVKETLQMWLIMWGWVNLIGLFWWACYHHKDLYKGVRGSESVVERCEWGWKQKAGVR